MKKIAIAAAALAFFAVITIPLFSRIDARPSSTAGNISVFLHASSVDEWSG
ncbi:MAG: hypothetical protein QXS96_04510 [Candidatus Caldarchaeum sp.]|nr:hypothetical protein [Candidatus Caldarchaeales archaeon]MDJ0272232.1 hypothetical protein [Candidatus Caldarchaeales archaeon]